MKKDAFVVKPMQPNVNLPKRSLQRVNKYLEGIFVSMINGLQKKTYTPKKAKKDPTNIATTIEEIQPTI